jgi:Lon protease-like protein
MQAIRATEIREELREVVFSEDVSNEDWAAWALMNLSPFSQADILTLANLTVTRHNIKTLFRMEGF